MLILTLQTDNPQAELGLFDDQTKLAYCKWPAHRALAETIHTKLTELLSSQQKTIQDLNGIAAFKGPGSFTGLRIGLAVVNALASSLGIPVVTQTSEDWCTKAIIRLLDGQSEPVALPEYGADPHITVQKK